MAKVYVARCIVKRDGKQYDKGSIIEGLTNDEIKKGLAEKWIEAVGNDGESSTVEKPAKENKRDKLIVKATELGIAVDDSITDADLDQKIKDAVARNKILPMAKELGIKVKDEMTNDEIRKLIKEAEAQ
jgi:hypothetical protein